MGGAGQDSGVDFGVDSRQNLSAGDSGGAIVLKIE